MPDPAALSDSEVANICRPLTQGAARIRFFRDVLRVPVQRRPDGQPLVRRSDWDRHEAQNARPAKGLRWSVPA